MAGHSFAEPVFAEDSEGGSQALFAVLALGLDVIERRDVVGNGLFGFECRVVSQIRLTHVGRLR
jgi:hypothetical protein